MRPPAAAILLLAAVLACGGSSTSLTNPNTTGTNNSGSGRTMTATYNGVAFNPTLLTSGYLNGQVVFAASDGARSFNFSAINVNGLGVYSVNPGNANSALAQWVDNTGSYSSGANGSGTVTFTVLQLGRVAGSFNFNMRTTAGGANTIAFTGTFDIKFP